MQPVARVKSSTTVSKNQIKPCIHFCISSFFKSARRQKVLLTIKRMQIYYNSCTKRFQLKCGAVSTTDAQQSVFGELKYSPGSPSCSSVQFGCSYSLSYKQADPSTHCGIKTNRSSTSHCKPLEFVPVCDVNCYKKHLAARRRVLIA